MELVFRKVNYNQVQVIVDFEKQNDSCDIETVVNHFSLSELENKYFLEFLKYLLSFGETEYQTWFEEFFYIPYEDEKPMSISSVDIRKIENGEVYSITLEQIN